MTASVLGSRPLREVIDRMDAGSGARPDNFYPDLVSGLPEPARRWLQYSIRPGTPLADSAQLSMHGTIRLGSWRPFTARQVILADAGFIWAARSRLFRLPLAGFDRYLDGFGEMRWRLAGLIPVMSAHGPDVTLSAAGRLAGELVLVPTRLVGASWTPAGADSAEFCVQIGPRLHRVRITVAADGRLRGVSLQRWGNPDGAGFRDHLFAVAMDGEIAAAGIRIPRELRASWSLEAGDFFHAYLDAVSFE